MQLTFEVNHQNITKTDNCKVVSDSQNYLTASFSFISDEWAGVTKTAVFRKGDIVKNQILTDDSCTVPWEVIKVGEFTVSVFGGDLITVDTATVKVEKSGYKVGETPEEPTPDVYQQIIYLLENMHPEIDPEELSEKIEQYFVENPINADLSTLDLSLTGNLLRLKNGTENLGNAVTLPTATQEQINAGVESYLDDNPINEDFRFKAVTGTLHLGYNYSYTQKIQRSTGTYYNCIEYEFDGTEKKIRFSGNTSGASDRVGWCFTDDDNNVISRAEFSGGENFENVVKDIPTGATKVYINGGNYESPHLEVSISDNRADTKWMPQLLTEFGKKLQYKDTFAWKPMPNAIFAFTFDDSLETTSTIVNTFETLGVPCCFGAIPDKLNMVTTGNETVAQAMARAVANGGEVLAHGNASEIVSATNIDDEDFLYKKFFQNKQKFTDAGFNVRGVVRVGGTDDNGNQNICGDARTDKWVKLFFDYSDLYGVSEPYNHPRLDTGASITTAMALVDQHITAKDFCPLLYHAMPSYINELVAYILAQGGQIKNYAYVYDTYGSTVDKVAVDTKISSLETSVGNIGTALTALTTVGGDS